MSDINPDGVVDEEGALDMPQRAASLGRLAGLDEPRLGGAVVGVKQDHCVAVATRGAHDGEHVCGGNKVYDAGSILSGVDTDKVAMIIALHEF